MDDELARLVEACRRSGLELLVHLWPDRPASFSLGPGPDGWPANVEHLRSALAARRYEVRDYLVAEVRRDAERDPLQWRTADHHRRV